MELTGKIKVLNETQNIGSKGFRKREIVITTNEQYPQHILVEFIQDKCDLLNNFKVGQDVKINLNLRGREWINPEGVAKYFNAIQGWRIEAVNSQEPTSVKLPEVEPISFMEDDSLNDDLPF
jgi:translation initiation factor IF-3